MRTGKPLWISALTGLPPETALFGSNIIPTEKLVYVAGCALDAATGEAAWSVPGSNIALAYGRLYTVSEGKPGKEEGTLWAYDADTGELLWERIEPAFNPIHPIYPPSRPAYFPVVADNFFYFYNVRSERVRALDTLTGTLVWSVHRPGVQAMAVADGRLLLLFGKKVEVWAPRSEIYFPEVASGQGITTLITLNNLSEKPTTATLSFVAEDGAPLPLPVEGIAGDVSTLTLSLSGHSTKTVQVLDRGEFRGGWARVVSELPLRGTAIFQNRVGEEIVTEAGVADAPPTGSANLHVRGAGTFSTALALANIADETAQLNFRLLDAEGKQVAQQASELPPQAHIARFFNELFDADLLAGLQLDWTNFEGSLVIESDLPVSITSLRTKNGYLISSFPVGQPVR